jgi:hypothetical protein
MASNDSPTALPSKVVPKDTWHEPHFVVFYREAMEFPELANPCSFRGCSEKNDFLPFTCVALP